MATKHYFVGFVCGPAPDSTRYIDRPNAPRNYKDPNKIAQYEQEALQDRLAGASRLPITGMVTGLTVLDAAGDPAIVHPQTQQPIPDIGPIGPVGAHAAIAWLSQLARDNVVWGLGIKQLYEMVALQALKDPECPQSYNSRAVASHPDNKLFDPYTYLVPGYARDTINVTALLHWAGVQAFDLGSAGGRADAARVLCQKTHLSALEVVAPETETHGYGSPQPPA